jgi:hypothetical protein
MNFVIYTIHFSTFAAREWEWRMDFVMVERNQILIDERRQRLRKRRRKREWETEREMDSVERRKKAWERNAFISGVKLVKHTFENHR